ncbi:MAG: septation protein SpoVG family protein [Ignavibacteria bacterium]|nr:septation protein SpoVG family protein [Ignavibacteria bacterium]
MKISRMNLFEGDSKLAAFFDLQTEEGIIIKGFRLVNGTNGLFVSAPSEKGKDDKYYDNVIIPKELKDSLQSMAVSEYNKLKGSGSAKSEDSPF